VELPRKLKPGIGAQNNFVAALQMVNEQLDKRFGGGRKRSAWATEEFGVAMLGLGEILNDLTREVKKLQDAKK